MSKLGAMLGGVNEGLVLKPHFESFLRQAKFPEEFTVTFRNAGEPRKPDGWFHPSTHPTMNVRQLYFYLLAKDDPDLWKHEEISYSSRLSITMGTAMHDLVEMSLKSMGLLTEPEGICVACGKRQPEECSEHGVLDVEHNTKGHMDGILTPFSRLGTAGMDFKTGNNFSLSKINDLDLEAFRRKWPYYYGQGQSYMLSTGLRNFVFLFLGLGYPWTVREFIVPFDEEYCEALAKKYAQAKTLAEIGRMPLEACCMSRDDILKCGARTCPTQESIR